MNAVSASVSIPAQAVSSEAEKHTHSPALRAVNGGVLADYPKIQQFLAQNAVESPCLVVDVDVVESLYRDLMQAFPYARCFYAIKANPAKKILDRMVSLGSCYDTASLNEIRMCLEAGAPAENILFGNTIKKQAEIAQAYALGVRMYTFDSETELKKIADSAPGSRVLCRIATDNSGAAWPLSKKFGCPPKVAANLLRQAKTLGLVPQGVSFHVGSQQLDVTQWNAPIAIAAEMFTALKAEGIVLETLNLGGGFPAQYRGGTPPIRAYGEAIEAALASAFGDARPDIIVEPGRYISGDAGVIAAEVVLINQDAEDPTKRWVYLDAGKFSGLIEPEAIEYPIVTSKDGDPKGRVIIAGPTCDSVDILYENAHYELPLTLEVGDIVYLLNTGAYTTTYAAIAFNGFPPLKDYYL